MNESALVYSPFLIPLGTFVYAQAGALRGTSKALAGFSGGCGPLHGRRKRLQ